jgi:CheY-like chemotaxis protein/DnaJ-domain-containing protein 1
VSKEVLIVEDDRPLAELLARALKLAGYRARVVHDGDAALEQLGRSKPALVLLDILLPRRDGRSVLAEIREREATRDLPVIAMSGVLRRPKQAHDLEEAGANAFLAKPFQGSALVGLVETFLGPPDSGRREGISLTRTSTAEVMWGAMQRGLSGALHFQAGKKRKALLLVEGQPRGVRSNVVRECLGRRLFEAGRIERAALEESLQRARAGEGRQGEILVRMGAVTRKDVDEALLNQGEDKLFELFTWAEGDVWFEPDSEALPLSTPMESYKAEEVILRGVQRMGPDVLRRALQPLRGKHTELDLSGLSEEIQRDPAVERAKEALEAGGGRTDDLLRQHGAVLFALLVFGALRTEEGQPEAKLEGLPEGPARAAVKKGPVTHAELLEVRECQAKENHFEILGLRGGASAAECKSAFFALAKRYHPDRFAGEPEEIRALAADVFARISVAHEMLSDPTQRQQYLASLKGKGKGEGEKEDDVSQILTAEVQFQKGEALLRKKEYARALEQFRWALDLNPEEGEYRAMHGTLPGAGGPREGRSARAPLRDWILLPRRVLEGLRRTRPSGENVPPGDRAVAGPRGGNAGAPPVPDAPRAAEENREGLELLGLR